jgi:hypothetical protein
MSLQFIVDAYNLTNHPAFKPVTKSVLNIQHALADFIRFKGLTGSRNNRLILVFDGYPPAQDEIPRYEGLLCLFSKGQEADLVIKKIVEESVSPKNIVVVSDDKQVQLSARLFRAQVSGVGDFIRAGKSNTKLAGKKISALDSKLSYSKMQKINEELKDRWLK